MAVAGRARAAVQTWDDRAAGRVDLSRTGCHRDRVDRRVSAPVECSRPNVSSF